ncbi:alpha/beta fold hydrolase [Thiothrix lacustris]|uniref:alpha/beta fold hydrolase n=1 Tax=Thiothrix lacustris TaxID=525917 RepID=UPI0027E5B83A|nr:alpha/beta fold hydrolase [Thiothrix lacustris]WMP18762.1 alpha/beta fold hydrolase [Thiothrix lacustris]
MRRYWRISYHLLRYLWWQLTSSALVEEGDIRFNGARIHYVAYGQGKPLVLLHGGLSNRLSWFAQLPWLVAAGRQVVLMDTRGHGKSTLGEAGLSYGLLALDVLQVLDHLDISQADLVGWSDGGIIALLLGRDAPQRVDRIVAISANFDTSGLIASALPALALLEETRYSLKQQVHRLWHNGPRLTQADLQAIHAPVLVMVGEKDVVTLAHSAQLAQWLSNGKLLVMTGAGHAAPVTHADDVAGWVADFLGHEVNQGE